MKEYNCSISHYLKQGIGKGTSLADTPKTNRSLLKDTDWAGCGEEVAQGEANG